MNRDLLAEFILQFTSLVLVPLSVAFIISLSKSVKLLFKRFLLLEDTTENILKDLKHLKLELEEGRDDILDIKKILMKLLTTNFQKECINEDELSELTKSLID